MAYKGCTYTVARVVYIFHFVSRAIILFIGFLRSFVFNILYGSPQLKSRRKIAVQTKSYGRGPYLRWLGRMHYRERFFALLGYRAILIFDMNPQKEVIGYALPQNLLKAFRQWGKEPLVRVAQSRYCRKWYNTTIP